MRTITVYTKPACVQCTFTKKELDRIGLEYNEIDLTQDVEASKQLQLMSFATAPVVEVDYGSGNVTRWGGFKPEMIRNLAAAAVGP